MADHSVVSACLVGGAAGGGIVSFLMWATGQFFAQRRWLKDRELKVKERNQRIVNRLSSLRWKTFSVHGLSNLGLLNELHSICQEVNSFTHLTSDERKKFLDETCYFLHKYNEIQNLKQDLDQGVSDKAEIKIKGKLSLLAREIDQNWPIFEEKIYQIIDYKSPIKVKNLVNSVYIKKALT